MKIYLDVDNTVMDSLTMNVKLLNKKFGLKVKPDDVMKWNFSDVYPNATKKDIYESFDCNEFFENVKLIQGAEYFINTHKDDIVFTTIGTPRNLEKKCEWLWSRGFGDCKFLGIPTTKTKGDYDMSDGVIVDDAQKNLFASNAKYKILFNHRQNWLTDWTDKWIGDTATSYHELASLLYGKKNIVK